MNLKPHLFLLMSFFSALVSSASVNEILDDLKDPKSDRVLVVSHRGDWRNAPENSLQGIRNCIEMGVDVVEVDVRMTKDGHLVLLHDETLNRTTTGKGDLSDLTLEEIEKLFLKNGAGHKTRHKIPTLEEALLLIKDKVLINLDKGYDYFDKILPVAQNTGTLDQIIIKSGNSYSEVKKKYPDLWNTVTFMPVINITDANAQVIVSEYLENSNVRIFELNFEHETPSVTSVFRQIKDVNGKIFVNSLWPELCASHDDDIAVESNMPGESWGWLINKGASLIQTDRPRELLSYIQDKTYNSSTIIYVDFSLKENGTGSIEAPYNNLTDAINNANCGDEIFLAQGEMTATTTVKAMASVNKSLSVTGGYDSSFTEVIGKTTFDGNGLARHIISINPYCEVRFANINITNGNASGANDDCGGGIYNCGTLIMENSRITNNKCKNSSGGGGIYNTGNLSLYQCEISNNDGYGDGGGIYSDSDGCLIINDCRFNYNSSKSGSAVFVKNASSCHISSSSFIGNVSETYGTITFYNKSYTGQTVLVNNTIANNTLSGHTKGKTNIGGSAIYWYANTSAVINVVNNTIIGNYCDGRDNNGNVSEQLGGAVFSRLGNMRLNNNIIAGNVSMSGFGDLYKLSESSITGYYNIYSAKNSINTTITPQNQCFDSADDCGIGIEALLDAELKDNKVIAGITHGNTFSEIIPLKGTQYKNIQIDCVPKDNLSEQVLNADLDNDGSLLGMLKYDQQKTFRSLSDKACIGAIEYDNESGIEEDAINQNIKIYQTYGEIRITGADSFDLRIFTMGGMLVKEFKKCRADTPIPTTGMQADAYMLEIRTSNKKSITSKILVK